MKALVFSFLLIGCATHAPKQKPVELKMPVQLSLGGNVGEKTLTAYHSDSKVEDFEDDQKVRDHEEVLDFRVSSEVVDARAGQLVLRTETVDKDGTGELHDFAFPEPGETIDFVYSRDGHVLRADPFPRESIFYLPPISLPTGPINIGDTWSMDHVWASANDGLPLHLNLVTIAKGVVPCLGDTCVDLEVSGQVQVMSENLKSVGSFESHLAGRVLFSVEKGDVIWSEVKSEERFSTKGAGMHVLSCMSSLVQRGSQKPTVTCTPDKQAVRVPTL